MIVATLGALVLLLQAPFGPARQPADAQTFAPSVEGVVVRAGSGEPLARAQVTLVRTATGTTSAADTARTSPSDPPTVTTGVDGRFAFRALEPGSYRISVARNGYTRQEYGQRVFGGQGRTMTLVAGQAVRGIVIPLLPAGNVSGVVSDSSGEPLAGAQIQLLRATYNAYGQRALQAAGGDRTNDRGEYRVYWVTPGRYYVAVQGAQSGRTVTIPGTAFSPNEIVDRRYPTAFHPGTNDLAQASILDVPPGVEVAADVVVPQQELFRVSGRIVDPMTGRPPENASVSMVQRGLPAGLGASGSSPTYTPADGTFAFHDVAAGSYWIRATVSARSADSVLPPGAARRTLADVFVDSLFSDRRVAQVAIDVSGDVDDLVLVPDSGVSIPGFVSVEGQPFSAVPGLERLEVTLRPATMGMITNPSRHQRLRADGAFTLDNVLPGEYVVSVQSLPPDYYVKDMRLEQTDAIDRLVVSAPMRGMLRVTLSPAGGWIDGVVLDDGGRVVAGIPAVLVPARRPARIDLYKTAVTDQFGRFVIRGIPPGEYTVFAWEAIEAFGYFDEDFLRRPETYGTPVRIHDSSSHRVNVPLIPATLP